MRPKKIILFIACLAALPLVLTPLYALVPPPITTVMIFKALGGAGITKDWEPLSRISPHLVRAVVVAEDGRFCEHHGIDWEAVREALKEHGAPRGASTISMQVVKNLYLWTGRSWLRKALEAPLALYADLIFSKRRMMEIYLNIAEWGPGIYGAQAAAKYYFHTDAARLTPGQAGLLAAILPSPNRMNAARPGYFTRMQGGLIARRAAVSGDYVGCVLGR